jgi:hypothetical protein
MTRMTPEKRRLRKKEGQAIWRDALRNREQTIAYQRMDRDSGYADGPGSATGSGSGWYCVMLNIDGRRIHPPGLGRPISCENAQLLAGAFRDEQTDESVGDGWSFVAEKRRQP